MVSYRRDDLDAGRVLLVLASLQMTLTVFCAIYVAYMLEIVLSDAVARFMWRK